MKHERELSLGLVGLFFLGLFFSFYGTSAFAENGPPVLADAKGAVGCGDANASLARIQSRYDEIEDLSARFTQISESVILAGLPAHGPATSGGEVVLAKPGRMRWSYLDPDASIVVSDGEVLWIYDVEAKQATRALVGQGYLAGAALQFLLGDGRLHETFDVKEVACSESRVELELKPQRPANYEKILVVADMVSGLVTTTSVQDLFGNRTTLTFSAIELNRSPDSSTFVFEKPEGVEVIDVSSGS